MSDIVKVVVAAVIGISAPATSGFFSNAEYVLQQLLTAGQIGVAAITMLYIWKKLRKLK